jgi:hypothetical protein
LAVTKRFADRGQEAPLLYGYARPDVIDELLFRDDLTRAIGKIEQNIQRPTADGTHVTVASESSLAPIESYVLLKIVCGLINWFTPSNSA